MITSIRDALNAIAVEQVSIQKKKKLIGEEWLLKKPREMTMRSLPMTQVVEKKVKEEKEDPMEKLKKLKELHDMGVISDEEFEEKKKKLMELI